jgi:inhibitor of KinA sporulation pathway (predicted exonuclease)
MSRRSNVTYQKCFSFLYMFLRYLQKACDIIEYCDVVMFFLCQKLCARNAYITVYGEWDGQNYSIECMRVCEKTSFSQVETWQLCAKLQDVFSQKRIRSNHTYVVTVDCLFSVISLQ